MGGQHNLTSKKVKAHHVQVESSRCKACEGEHEIFKCKKFSFLDNKMANNCNKCERKHHSLIHRDFTKSFEDKSKQNFYSSNPSKGNLLKNKYSP